MKSFSNRKYYNFSKRQKQRAKNGRKPRWDKVGKDFAKIRESWFHAKNRETLRQLLKGREAEFARHRRTDSWDAW